MHSQRRLTKLTKAAVPCTAQLFVLIGVSLLCGCEDPAVRRGPSQGSRAGGRTESEAMLLDSAMNLLFTSSANSGELAVTVRNYLDNWSKSVGPPEGWRIDPLVSALPEKERDTLGFVTLASLEFTESDIPALQEVVWLRELSERLRGSEFDELKLAERLFDWVVRNIQLDADSSDPLVVRPRELLMLGHGRAVDRTWLCVLLARQQGLTAVGLECPAADDKGSPRTLLGVLVEERLHLFDPTLGLPLAGKDGTGVVTLAEAVADDALLRHMDIDTEHRYPLTAEQLGRATALLEASPLYVMRRMRRLEMALAGAKRLVLSTVPQRLADKLRQAGVSQARLWTEPLASLLAVEPDSSRAKRLQQEFRPFGVPVARQEKVRQRSGAIDPSQLGNQQVDATESTAARTNQQHFPLSSGRVLHLRGTFDGAYGAKDFYLLARPSDDELAEIASQLTPEGKSALRRMKQNASYWLGLIAFEQAKGTDYSVAIDFLANRTLAAAPNGPWTWGARYNLARAQEAAGNLAEAIKLYQADDSPQSYGNQLRAKRLGK